MTLKFMYITNHPDMTRIAQEAGVDRIWIDLEKLGKKERQKNCNSVKSNHNISDIMLLKPLLNTSELLVRIDPINKNTKDDIEQVIANGADVIMLPMFKTKEEVQKFINYVNGRITTVILVETKEAVENIHDILSVNGIDEVHIGLNDLHLSYGMKFMFELLSNGMVEKLCNIIKDYNIPYGFGGIARVGEGLLPAECIITEHYRLGSSRAILSRSFCDLQIGDDDVALRESFISGVESIKKWENTLPYKNQEYFIKNMEEIKKIVKKICEAK